MDYQQLSQLEQQVHHEMQLALHDSFYFYIKEAWSIIDPTPYIDNWYVECIAEHLQGQEEGVPELQKILLSIQPRTSKSNLGSVLYPSWIWLRDASRKLMTVSNKMDLAIELTTKSRALIESPWYQDMLLPDKKFKFLDDSNTKEMYVTDKLGHRVSTSPGSIIIGKGGDTFIVDDPNDIRDLGSAARQKTVIDFYTNGLRNRQNNMTNSTWLVIQQRLGKTDLIQHLLDNEGDDWFHLVLPTEYTPKYTFISPIGYNDPRTVEGELLDSKRFTPKFIEQEKKNSFMWWSAYQQQPRSLEGNIIKQSHLRHYTVFPKKVDFYICSVDLAESKGTQNDYTVATVWAISNKQMFLAELFREKLDFDQQLLLVALLNYYYTVHLDIQLKILIEAKSNASALINMLQKDIPNIQGVNLPHRSDKIQRLFSVFNWYTYPSIFLPTDDCPRYHKINSNQGLASVMSSFLRTIKTTSSLTVSETLLQTEFPFSSSSLDNIFLYTQELFNFPSGANDDCVDATVLTQHYLNLEFPRILSELSYLEELSDSTIPKAKQQITEVSLSEYSSESEESYSDLFLDDYVSSDSIFSL